MGEVKIFRASAGSGKTHRLTLEYLNLLSGDDRAYRRILAVTFTNKATDEMKRRVIEHLYKKSSQGDERASRLLKNILHDYSSFNISTIDRFFQQTLRAFAREIGKSTSYGVELNEDMVRALAIDKILFNLDTLDNNRLLNWILELSVQRIDSGKSWDIRSSINSTSSQLFKEAYRTAVKGEDINFLSKESIEEYSEIIASIISEYEKKMVEFGNKGVEILTKSELSPYDFANKKSSFAQRFRKLAEGDFSLSNLTFTEAGKGIEKWFSKSAIKDSPDLLIKGGVAESLSLGPLINEILDYEESYSRDYFTAINVSKNLYALGLMSDIQKSIQEVCEENGVMLLTETTELLNGIIDGSDTPFIFEKIGARTDHFMLDEFQDTSLMQWENFRPLLKNSLSSGYSNLIVGDEKQSIYRWRGSDWMLLNKRVFNQFSKEEINSSALLENWRSGKEIIEFINDFFPGAADACDNILDNNSNFETSVASIYSSVIQKIPKQNEDKRGYVELRFGTKSEANSDDSEDYQENEGSEDSVLNFVREKIEFLISNGSNLSDIAVLVRKNKEGAIVANHLINSGIKVISGDSLFIMSSSSVSSIISQLRYLSNPMDSVNNILARFSGLEQIADNEISSLPLYELCECLFETIPEETKRAESAYILAFLDKVKEFVKQNRSDLYSFLEWWNDSSDKLTIPAPDGEDAVRVMTIHKSKGLGFSSVIIPFSDFEFKGKQDILWCKPARAPFNRMPVVPVNMSEKLVNTHFSPDYEKECFLSVVDNLNLAYVAFTRAKDNLFIYVTEPSKQGKKAKGVGDILSSIYSERAIDKRLVIGDSVVTPDRDRYILTEREMPLLRTYDNSANLRLTLRSEEFFNDKENSRTRGVVIHSIMSKISTAEDVYGAVNEAAASGEIELRDKENTINYILQLVNSVEKFGWFSQNVTVMNEIGIILPGGEIYRPDRIVKGAEFAVIDFKTGKQRSNSHIKQIEKYTSSVREMGVKNVHGYLWYLDENIIEKVN